MATLLPPKRPRRHTEMAVPCEAFGIDRSESAAAGQG
jgi:hypothetical protein